MSFWRNRETLMKVKMLRISRQNRRFQSKNMKVKNQFCTNCQRLKKRKKRLTLHSLKMLLQARKRKAYKVNQSLIGSQRKDKAKRMLAVAKSPANLYLETILLAMINFRNLSHQKLRSRLQAIRLSPSSKSYTIKNICKS